MENPLSGPRIRGRVTTWLLVALVTWLLIGALFSQRGPSEGAPCGLAHHWANIAGPGDYDPSCERD